MAYRSKTFSSSSPSRQDSPSTAFRYGQIGDAFDSIDYSDYGSIVDERSISAPSDLGGLFILRPKVWKHWLLGVLAYTFAICLENVIIFPSLWPRLLMFCDQYTSDELRYYLGTILGAFSAGRCISAILLNLHEHSRKSMKIAGLLCFLLSISSSFLYTIAWSPKILIVSRTLAGLGAGALTLLLGTIVSATSNETRTSSIANFFIAAAVGEVAGPLIAYVTISLKFTVADFQFDSYNLVGVWTFLIFCLTFPWAFRSFVANPSRRTVKANTDVVERHHSRLGNDGAGLPSNDGSGETICKTLCTRNLVSLDMILIFFIAIINNAAVSALETIVVPVGDQNFGWGVSENSIVFIVSGMLLFFSNIVLVKVASCIHLDDGAGMYFSILVALLGALMLFHDSSSTFFFMFGNASYAIGIFCLLTFLSSMFTKSIRERPNFFIGILRASSAGIRVVGNILAANTLTNRSSFQPCKNHQKGGGNFTLLHRENRGTNFKMDTIERSGTSSAMMTPEMLLLIFPLIMLILALARSLHLCSLGETSLVNEENHVVDTDYGQMPFVSQKSNDETDDDSEILDFDLIS